MSRIDPTTTGSIFSNARGALARFAQGVGLWSRYGGWGWSRVRLLLPGAKFDWERESGDPWMNSVVSLGLSWIGDRLPRPRLKVCRVGRAGNLIEQSKHGLVDLWSRPNPFYGRRTLEKAIGLSLKVDGNAYLYKVRDNGGRVTELWWIPHFRILPTWPADGSSYIDGYRVWLDSGVWDLAVSDVLHIRDGIDPRNERLGIAALKGSLREVCTINYESSYTAALLKNSGVPAVAIVPDGDEKGPTTRDEADRMAERFADGYTGDDVGRPIIMGGRYKVVPVGFSPENLVLDKLPQNAQARVAASIGVAAMSLGLPDPGKTYANLGEANRTSWGTIVAMQELIAEAVRNDLIAEAIQVGGRVTPAAEPRDYVVEYDYSQIQELQESLDSLHKRVRDDFLAELITRNEARDETGREPDAGDGDLYYSEIKAGAAPEPPEPEPADGEGAVKSWRAPFELLDLDAKYNHYHDPRTGRFSHGGGHASGATGSASPLSARPGGPPPSKPKPKPAAPSGGGSGSAASKPVDLGTAKDAEVGKVYKDMSAGWKEGLSPGEKKAVKEYSSNSYSQVNSYARTGNGQGMGPDRAEKIIGGVDAALSKASLAEPMVVYRGISDITRLGLNPKNLNGAVLHDKGFLSTSLTPKVAHEFAETSGKHGAILKITAPKGSKGASMAGNSKFPKEREVVFARNAKLKVTGTSKDSEGRLVIEMELSHAA